MTKTKPTFPERMSALIVWTHSPDLTSLEPILAALSDEDLSLIAISSSDGSAAGRIAWLEYAKRRKYLDFSLEVSVAGGTVQLKASAPALPLHEGVLLGARKSS